MHNIKNGYLAILHEYYLPVFNQLLPMIIQSSSWHIRTWSSSALGEVLPLYVNSNDFNSPMLEKYKIKGQSQIWRICFIIIYSNN